MGSSCQVGYLVTTTLKSYAWETRNRCVHTYTTHHLLQKDFSFALHCLCHSTSLTIQRYATLYHFISDVPYYQVQMSMLHSCRNNQFELCWQNNEIHIKKNCSPTQLQILSDTKYPKCHMARRWLCFCRDVDPKLVSPPFARSFHSAKDSNEIQSLSSYT